VPTKGVAGIVVVLISWWIGVVAVAHAEKQNPVEKLAGDAAAAYRAADYARAVQLLERAYKLQPVSALLYNLAKAYDKLGESDRALDLYGRYSGADDADPRLRSKAEARVVALRELKEPSRRSDTPPRKSEPPPRPEPQAKKVEAPEGPPPAPPTIAEPPPPVRDPAAEQRRAFIDGQRRDRYVAMGLGAVGLAAIGTAVGLSVNVLSIRDQFTSSLDENAKRSLRDSASGRAIGADVGFVVGAAAVGVAVYFLYRGYRAAPRSAATAPHHFAAAPWLAPGAGGVAMGAQF